MAQIGYLAAETLVNLLRSNIGLISAVDEISVREGRQLTTVGVEQVVSQNVLSEVVEKGKPVRFPMVYVYCDRVQNTLREKFRVFSGTARLIIEVRVSKERLEGLEHLVHSYVDALTEVLTQSRGDWGQGICYSGEYEIQFSGAKLGGLNYVQTGKIVFDVGVSKG